MYTHKIVFLACLLFATSAQGSIIYDNGTPHYGQALFADTITPQWIADDFVLAPSENTITDIHWWGFYSGVVPLSDNFIIEIYADTGGSPELTPTVLDINVSDIGRMSTDIGPNLYEHMVFIDPLELVAGDTYWLSVTNSTNTWAWASATPGADTGGNSVFRRVDGAPWGVGITNTELAFNLTNHAVPEPSTLALLGIGLAGMGFARKKRKSA